RARAHGGELAGAAGPVGPVLADDGGARVAGMPGTRPGRPVGRPEGARTGGAAAGGHGDDLDAEVLAQVGQLGEERTGVDRPPARVPARGAGDQLVDLPR